MSRERYDPEKSRNERLRRRYGIDSNEYEKILKRQGKGCGICGKKRDSKIRSLAVDHCHTSGRVRGVLCTNCNNLLGRAKDSVKVLKKAIKYLERK